MSSLSIVLPAHNEEATVRGVVEEVSDVSERLGMEYAVGWRSDEGLPYR
jgi:hypothetical protein